MVYIIASPGRSGSTALARLVHSALGQKGMPIISDYSDFCKYPGQIVKTHLNFKKELPGSYKAVYIYCDIGDYFASLYFCLGKGFYRFHFTNMGIDKRYLKNFLRILNFPFFRGRKFLAFLYLAAGDKLCLEEKFISWQKSKQVLFVSYKQLCNRPKDATKKISKHFGLSLGEFKPIKRRGSFDKLPFLLRLVIKLNYTNIYS